MKYFYIASRAQGSVFWLSVLLDWIAGLDYWTDFFTGMTALTLPLIASPDDFQKLTGEVSI